MRGAPESIASIVIPSIGFLLTSSDTFKPRLLCLTGLCVYCQAASHCQLKRRKKKKAKKTLIVNSKTAPDSLLSHYGDLAFGKELAGKK
jgi:hypothetical protein